MEAANQILLNDCLNMYVDAMQSSMSTNQNQFDFMDLHQKSKNAAISQVQKTLNSCMKIATNKTLCKSRLIF